MITLLAITSIMIRVNSGLPKISYLKASDIYMCVCIVFILAVIMESVYVAFVARWVKELREGQQAEQKLDTEVKDKDSTTDGKERGAKVLYGFEPRYLDWGSRVGFPIIFLIFNIVYWSFYISLAQNMKVDDLVYLE